jgi:hypothetical protein
VVAAFLILHFAFLIPRSGTRFSQRVDGSAKGLEITGAL